MSTALLAPMLFMAVSFAHELMRCRITGVVIQTCACPDDQGASGPRLQAQSCCQRESVEAVSIARPATDVVTLPLPYMAVMRALPIVPRQLLRSWASKGGFRPTGPPLVLLKQSFLI